LWAVAFERLLLARLSASWCQRLLWASLATIVLVEGARCLAGESPMMMRDGPALGPVVGRDERVLVNYL